MLSNRDTSQTVNLQITSSPSATGTVAELTFEKGESVFERLAPALNSLVEANFELKVVGSQVTTSIGDHPMAGDHLFGNQPGDAFFRLFGDSDGDRDVDGQDHSRFGLTFLQSPTDHQFNAWLDMIGDGDVDGQDFGQFGRRLLKTMPF